MRALIISDHGFEEAELLVPYYRLQEAGWAVTLAATHAGTIEGKHGYPLRGVVALEAVRAEDFQALVLPGGQAPERLRQDPLALQRVREFAASGRPLAAICHGPLLLAAAGVVAGRTLTAYPAVWEALRQAGAKVVDEAAVVDGTWVTARRPADIPAWMRAFMACLSSA